MNPISTDKLEAMLAGAKLATPGPWQLYDGSSWRRIGTVGGRYDDCAVLAPNVASDGHPDMHAGRGQDTYANLNHIVACDPDTITSLITAYLAACAENEDLRRERDEARDEAEATQQDRTAQEKAARDAVAWWKEAVARREAAERELAIVKEGGNGQRV